MAKKYMPLLVRLDKADLDRMKKAIEVLRLFLLGHGADCTINSGKGKPRKTNQAPTSHLATRSGCHNATLSICLRRHLLSSLHGPLLRLIAICYYDYFTT